MHQDERAGTESGLNHTRFKAGLPKEGGLLIACCAEMGMPAGSTLDPQCGPYTSLLERPQAGPPRECQDLQELRIPLQLPQIEQQGARRVGVICAVDGTAGKLVNQPRIDGTKANPPWRAFALVQDNNQKSIFNLVPEK